MIEKIGVLSKFHYRTKFVVYEWTLEFVLRSKRNRQQAYLNLLSNDPCHGHSVQNQSNSMTNLNNIVERDTFSSWRVEVSC